MASFLAGAMLVAAISVTVDPYGLFGLADLDGFNRIKTTRTGDRDLKSIALRQERFDVIVLGTSRVNEGIDAHSPIFGDARVYNAGLTSINMKEMRVVVDFMLQHQKPRKVLIGLDLIQFEAKREYAPGFAESGFSGRPLPLVIMSRVFSTRALRNSIATILDNYAGRQRRSYDSRGNFVRPKGIRYDHRQAFDDMVAYYARWELFVGFEYGADRVEELRAILEKLLASDVEVYLFVNPVHAVQMELMYTFGLADDFERMERDVVALVSELSARQSREDRLRLWDFSGFNSITTETVPAPGSERPMRWFWDQAHYRQATGDLILRRMFHADDGGHPIPGHFGVEIGPQNLETHIAAIRTGYESYARNHTAEVDKIARLICCAPADTN